MRGGHGFPRARLFSIWDLRNPGYEPPAETWGQKPVHPNPWWFCYLRSLVLLCTILWKSSRRKSKRMHHLGGGTCHFCSGSDTTAVPMCHKRKAAGEETHSAGHWQVLPQDRVTGRATPCSALVLSPLNPEPSHVLSPQTMAEP